jgi:molybdenum cofactor cytidylyltransferase
MAGSNEEPSEAAARLRGPAESSGVGAVVLAAGRSSRYRAGGGVEETKLVAEIGGEPIVRRVVRAALASRARPVVVIVGHARGAVEAALAGLPPAIVFNSDFATGLASSLSAGLAALPSEAAAALVLLGDMPNVDAGLIDRLIEAFEGHPEALAVAPVQGGRRGNPVLLAKSLFEAAMRLAGDEGARRLLVELDAAEVIEIDAAGSDVSFDVDTPDDLAAAGARQPPDAMGRPI